MLTEPTVGRTPMNGYFITYIVIVGEKAGTSNATYQLVSAVNNSSVLDVAGAGTSNGTKVQLWENANVNQQKWKITNVDGGYYKIQPLHAPGMALDVTGAGTTDGTQVQIYTDNGTNAQKWKITDVGGGYFTLSPANATSLNLDVNAMASSNGTKVQIWSANNTYAQKWKLIKQ
ncbi:TPA: RICIN domain-containing protein [Elizabethkingia anophelis]